jgi:hypothetical protein
VPLSENEQRQLEAIERALAVEDPKFAATLHGSDLRSHTLRRLRRSIALFALGLALLACVFVTPWLAGAGAALMFIGLLGIVGATKRLSGHESTLPSVLDIGGSDFGRADFGGNEPGRNERGRNEPGRDDQHHPHMKRPRPAAPRQSWRDRVEDRWRRRWEEPDD